MSGAHVTLPLAIPRTPAGDGRYVSLWIGASAGPPITLSPGTLPSGETGTAYSATLTATGAAAPYTFDVASGTLPAGLTLSSAGVLSGTPTTSASLTFVIRATDSTVAGLGGPYVGVRSYNFTIDFAPWTGLQSESGVRWTRRAGVLQSLQSGWNDPIARHADLRAEWSRTPAVARDLQSDWNQSTSQQADAQALWSARAQKAQPVSVPWSDFQRLQAESVAPWRRRSLQTTSIATPFGSPPILEDVRAVPWGARPAVAREISAQFGSPTLHRRELVLPWKQATGVHWFIPDPSDPLPPPPPPNGRSGRHITLRFACPRRIESSRHISIPFGPWQCYLGRQLPKVIIVNNTVSIVRVPDNEPIAASDVSIRGDLTAATWSCSASISDDASFALLQPGPSGDARRIRVTINGFAWEFLVETPDESARFGGKDRSIQGRSPAALLSSEYAPKQTVTQTSARDASQLAAEVLDGTGFTLDWSAVDWLVPGGVWSYSDLAPLDALRHLAEACGATVQSHRTADTVRVAPFYSARPWQWAVTAPDIEIVDDYLKHRRSGAARGIRHNRVEVRGEVGGGIRGICTIDGTAGEISLPQVTHKLITAVAAAEARGIYELSRVGPIGEASVDLPLFPAPAPPGLLEPGMLARVSGSYRGLITAVAIRATWLDQGGLVVNQSATMERHYDA